MIMIFLVSLFVLIKKSLVCTKGLKVENLYSSSFESEKKNLLGGMGQKKFQVQLKSLNMVENTHTTTDTLIFYRQGAYHYISTSVY